MKLLLWDDDKSIAFLSGMKGLSA